MTRWSEPPLEGLEHYAAISEADADQLPATTRRAWAMQPGAPLGSCGVCCAVIVLDPEGANLEQHFAALHDPDPDPARRDVAAWLDR